MRWFAGLGLVVAMLAFGIGVYHAAGMLRGDRHPLHRPDEVSAPTLPGTMYIVQAGAIYRFQHGSFTQMTSENGWMQPGAGPAGQLVAVRRQGNSSDLYLLSTGGKTVAQLTHNASTGPAEQNHWAFYPRFSADGQTLFYDFDPKEPYDSYRVDLAVFASRIDPNSRTVEWTQPNDYTGGDVNPVPLRGGGLVYTKYSIDDSFQVHAQIWVQRRAQTAGQALTTPDLNCGQPALSPDEKLMAMVCTKGSSQSAELDVAAFDPAALTLGSPATLVSGQLIAVPAFSPDGKTIAYLAPVTPGGHFQLWTVDSTGPASIRNITTDLGLDSTSAPVWVGG
jgi:Tol biopolymer transport system component